MPTDVKNITVVSAKKVGSDAAGDDAAEQTKEALVMISEYEDEDLIFGRDIGKPFGAHSRREGRRDTVLGRMPTGLDESDFDAMPPREVDINPATNPDLFNDTYRLNRADTQDDEYPEFLAGDEVPSVFEPPAEEHFPVLKQALKKFQAAEAKPRVVRIDTDETYNDFVCEKAVNELTRRVDELQAALEKHEDDPEAHHGLRSALERHIADPSAHRRAGQFNEVLGAAQAVADLRSATTADEAASAMPKVPVDLPEYAEGKVKCWRDGNDIICSMRFSAADGTARIATMAARPRVDAGDAERWAMASGVNPVTVLGALPDLADVACGKKLVRDVAGAALNAQRRVDVCGMSESGDAEPLLLVNKGEKGSAPLAALMHLQQRAEAGDQQAKLELRKLQKVATTPLGRKVAAPLLVEAGRRLSAGRRRKALVAVKKPSFITRYTLMGGWL